jgi:hypothetical protein
MPVPPPAPAAGATAARVEAADLTDGDVGVMPPLGEFYAGAVPMLGKAVPLPSGRWQVVAQQRSTFPGYPPGARVTLLRAEGSVLTGVLDIAGDAVGRPSPIGWPLNPICEGALRVGTDPAVLGGDARSATAGGAQDCVLVSFQASVLWRAPGASAALQALSRSLAQLGVVPPATLVAVAIGQTDARWRLTQLLWLNPDLAGIPPDPEPRPDHSAWTADVVDQDVARRAYVARLLAWAEGWRAVVRQALTDPAVTVLPSVAEIR